jgi:hypothetical protein
MSDESRFAGRHASEPDSRDEGFCRCGLGLDAWVHTDTKRYTEQPLTEGLWEALWKPAGGGA